MKSSLFRLRTSCIAIFAITVFASTAIAQPFNFRVELVDFHSGSTGGRSEDITMIADGSGERLFVVGSSTFANGATRAFVYDRRNNEFIDIPTLLGLDENTWIGSKCLAISSSGIVVGYVRDTAANPHGCWFDILATNPSLNLLEDTFPEIVDGNPLTSTLAIDVNANGEVLTENGWVVNIDTGSSLRLPPEILTGGVTSDSAINELGTVIGYRAGVGSTIRYNIHTNAFDEIDGSKVFFDLNNVGEFCGYANIPYSYRGNQTRTRVQAYRWGFNNDYDWLSDPALPAGISDFITSESLNDSGDVVGQVSKDHEPLGFFYDGFLLYSDRDSNGYEVGTTYLLTDLVNDPYLNSASLWGMDVTERDTSLGTPAPIIVGNAETESDEKIFILIPEIPTPPTTKTYSRTHSPSLEIPNLGTVTSTIEVTDNFVISDLNVTLNINHQRAQDLDVYLIAPNGTRVHLFTDVGGNGVNFVGTTLDDEATTAITSGAAPFTGSYRPEGSLGAVNDPSTLGLWKLEVTDDKALKTGTILNWSFTVELP